MGDIGVYSLYIGVYTQHSFYKINRIQLSNISDRGESVFQSYTMLFYRNNKEDAKNVEKNTVTIQ